MDLPAQDRLAVQSFTFEQFVATLRRRRKQVGIVFVCAVIGAYAAIQFMPEKYEAEAAVLVKLGRESVEVPNSVSHSGVYSTGVRKEDVNSEIRLLKSRRLTELAVDEIGVAAFMAEAPRPRGLIASAKYYAKRGYKVLRRQVDNALIGLNLSKELSDREKSIEAVQAALAVEPEKESDVINIRLRMTNPQLAARTVDALLRLFMEKRVEARRSAGVRELFEKQFRNSEEGLDQTRKQIMSLKKEWNLSSAAEQRKLLLERINDLQKQIDGSQTERDAVVARQAAIETRMKEMPDRLEASVVTQQNPSFLAVKERLTSAELERIRYASVMLANSTTLRTIERQFGLLTELMAGEPASNIGSITTQLNPVKQDFGRELEESRVKLVSLETTIRSSSTQAAELKQALWKLDTGDDLLSALERDRAIQEGMFMNYAQRQEEARIADEQDLRRISNISVLTPTVVPSTPVYPRKMLIMGIALVAGLLLGIGFAVVVEYLGDRVYARNDIEGIAGMTFLGTFESRRGNGVGKAAVGSEN